MRVASAARVVVTLDEVAHDETAHDLGHFARKIVPIQAAATGEEQGDGWVVCA